MPLSYIESLSGVTGSLIMRDRNTFAIFIVSGFWHGANWTFIIWGALNAIYFLPLLLLNKNRINTDVIAQNKNIPSLKELLLMINTFMLTVFAWIFFRAENIGHAFSYIKTVFSESRFTIPEFQNMKQAGITLLLIIFFMIIEWFGRKGKYAYENIKNINDTFKRHIIYDSSLFILFY